MTKFEIGQVLNSDTMTTEEIESLFGKPIAEIIRGARNNPGKPEVLTVIEVDPVSRTITISAKPE